MSHTTGRGELVSLSRQFVQDASSAADKGHWNKARKRDEPRLSAVEAIIKAARNVGEQLQLADIQPHDQAEGAERRQKFKAKNLNGRTAAKLAWLPMSPTEMRLCWEVILTGRTRGEMFRLLIDAESGEVLVRHGLTEYLADATFRVFSSDSPSPFSPAYPTPQTNQPPEVPRGLFTFPALNTNA